MLIVLLLLLLLNTTRMRGAIADLSAIRGDGGPSKLLSGNSDGKVNAIAENAGSRLS
jgi:hypothetical protein